MAATATMLTITERDIAAAVNREQETTFCRELAIWDALVHKYGFEAAYDAEDDNAFTIVPPRDEYEKKLATWWSTPHPELQFVHGDTP